MNCSPKTKTDNGGGSNLAQLLSLARKSPYQRMPTAGPSYPGDKCWHSGILKSVRLFSSPDKAKKWVMKDLGKLKGNEMMVVLDADHDGQVNDAIIEYGQTRRVFSRMKDGTIVERLNLPDFQADLDGDRKDDAVYLVRQAEMRIRCSSGCKASLKLPPYTFIAVADIDGDKVAEIVGVEGVITDRRLYCWYCKNGKWHRSLTLKFSQMNWTVLGGDVRFRDVSLSGFPSETAAMLFRDEKGVYLLAVTEESGQVKIWGVRWRKGKWTKHLMGEVPEPDTIWVRIVRVGQE